jgi:hypothetical protein
MEESFGKIVKKIDEDELNLLIKNRDKIAIKIKITEKGIINNMEEKLYILIKDGEYLDILDLQESNLYTLFLDRGIFNVEKLRKLSKQRFINEFEKFNFIYIIEKQNILSIEIQKKKLSLSQQSVCFYF